MVISNFLEQLPVILMLVAIAMGIYLRHITSRQSIHYRTRARRHQK